MSYIVVIWRIDWTEDGPAYRDYVHGPYREEERAHERAELFKRLLKRAGLDDEWQVAVSEVWPGSYAPTELVEHLKEMRVLNAADAAARASR